MFFNSKTSTTNNPYNDSYCKLAIQSYNAVDGSTDLVDISNGSPPHIIFHEGLVKHTTGQTTPYINSTTSIQNVDSQSYCYINGSNDFNFYDEDFTILIGIRIPNCNAGTKTILTYYQDSSNYWRLYYTINYDDCRYSYLYFRYVYNGTDRVYLYRNQYSLDRTFYVVQMTRFNNKFYLLVIGSNSAGPVYSQGHRWNATSSATYLPPFDPARSKLYIGTWPNPDGTIDENNTFTGWWNTLVISKRNFVDWTVNPIVRPL